ncbi:MAG: twin-arginine translocase subunit TatC [Candidatus Cryptobacteroides sp.]|nr:twin-arginine translocase subunit TatC [Bacteroidales bacterium]MDY4572252.1 twin-arginine translocase subunit TatC [Candidatus Cryptobacteroides sp.]MCI7635759.1 twin-arginine translocase subunit TatC [Bacteroidales bacterium]MDD7083914.1 twin-arginine translocase subunit TatC [Bacteroidales bacterium]MDY5262878.1 twin-arginine translocase subunit TatC [Candidatus Cryptobacteroides sp.]
MSEETGEMSFWDHLDVLRGTLFRSALSVFLASIVMFCFKDFLFGKVILAPSRPDFFMYKILGGGVSMQLINTEVSAQFFVHLKVSFICGLVIAFPYIIYEIWKFIAPALYDNEMRSVRKAFLGSALLFYAGVATGFCLIFPVTLSFFQGYTVSDAIANTITLNSYISMFSSMVILFGIVFEFPVLIAILSNMGIVTREMLTKYRKHAFVGVLIVAAVITPADPFSMLIAAAPLYLLYELSVIVCVRK